MKTIGFVSSRNYYDKIKSYQDELEKNNYIHLFNTYEDRINETIYNLVKHIQKGDIDYGVIVDDFKNYSYILATKISDAVVTNLTSDIEIELTRQHNDAKIICISSYELELNNIQRIINKFVSTEFEGDRHIKRLDQLKNMSKKVYKGE